MPLAIKKKIYNMYRKKYPLFYKKFKFNKKSNLFVKKKIFLNKKFLFKFSGMYLLLKLFFRNRFKFERNDYITFLLHKLNFRYKNNILRILMKSILLHQFVNGLNLIRANFKKTQIFKFTNQKKNSKINYDNNVLAVDAPINVLKNNFNYKPYLRLFLNCYIKHGKKKNF